MALEQPDYEVLLVVGDTEFRRYEPYNVAEVTVDGNNPDREAFSILAGYIFGGNADDEKMSMTAPVESRDRNYAFVMEKKYPFEALPRPDDERIRLLTRPARIVAVRRFSGRWTPQNFARHETLLLDGLEKMGVQTSGRPELARYNPPFTPWFLRRNEIIVPIAALPGAAQRPVDAGVAASL